MRTLGLVLCITVLSCCGPAGARADGALAVEEGVSLGGAAMSAGTSPQVHLTPGAAVPLVSPAAADAIARGLLREAYWRGWWGDEESARRRILGATLVVVVGPPGPSRNYCLPELQVFAFVSMIGKSLVAELSHNDPLGSCDADIVGNTTTTMKIPSDVELVDLEPRLVAERVVALERSLRGKGPVRVLVSLDHTYEAHVAYAWVPSWSHDPQLYFFGDHGEVVMAAPMQEPAARDEDGPYVARMLRRHGARVRVP